MVKNVGYLAAVTTDKRIASKIDNDYAQKYLPKGLSLASEIVHNRLKYLYIPNTQEGMFLKLGANTLITGKLNGSQPFTYAGNFLKYEANLLPK